METGSAQTEKGELGRISEFSHSQGQKHAFTAARNRVRNAAEGADSGRCFALGIHPWLFGMPHRIRYLDETLARLAAYDDVSRTTLGAISDHMHGLHAGR